MEQRIEIDRLEQAVNIFGSFDENIRLIEEEFQVLVTNREGELRINGEPEDVMLAAKAIHALLTLSSRGETIGEQTVSYVIGLARKGQEVARKPRRITIYELELLEQVCETDFLLRCRCSKGTYIRTCPPPGGPAPPRPRR